MFKLYVNIKSMYIKFLFRVRNDILPVTDYVPNIGHRYVSYNIVKKSVGHIHTGARDIHCKVTRESRGY